MAALSERRPDSQFAALFVVMLAIAGGNTALLSVLPALGRSLGVPDSGIAAAFSISAFAWVIAAPRWARRSDHRGRRRMVLIGMTGFTVSLLLCGVMLTAGIRGWVHPLAAFGGFIVARLIYGMFGAAAPPATQALVAARTSRAGRTRALTLLASAFGLGTILGPALAPFLVLPYVGLAGPAFIFALGGLAVIVIVLRSLPDDAPGARSDPDDGAHGAANAYPALGSQPTGASVTAAAADRDATDVAMRDPRVWPWLLSGLVLGHAQAMTGQAIAFLVMDRLALPPSAAQDSIGIVLMIGAGAALLVQWGIIPLLDLRPRALMLCGVAISALGCALTGFADSLYGIATAYALASAGFGFSRPGFTAGASLAVGSHEQGAVAGRVTAINGAAYVLGPSIGVGLYQAWQPLPYWIAAGGLALLLFYIWVRLERGSAEDGLA